MTENSTAPITADWTGLVPVDDTALAVTDTGGPGLPVVYLNGQFATQGYWRRVLTSEKVASNHGAILRKDFRAVAGAVRGLANA